MTTPRESIVAERLPDYLKTAYDTFAECINGKASPEDAWDKTFYPVFIKAILQTVSTTRADERKAHEKEENSPPQLTSDNIRDAVKDAISEALNASPPYPPPRRRPPVRRSEDLWEAATERKQRRQ
ncbi:hypothetical protein E4U61_002877 [Claviceps capensis]|nr:hypothetical protein E4U61_002877 [Claviceps capensis]